MLRSRHRRRRYNTFLAHEESPRWIIRMAIGVVILLIFWYLGKTFLSFFLDSSLEHVAARLTVENNTGTQVSLQGGALLRAENGLKLYRGDTISTQYGGTAILSFFDGTNIRLDRGTELIINENKKVTNGTSEISVTVSEGRIWIQSAHQDTFTGSIVRILDLGVAEVRLPANASGLFSKDLIFLTEAHGIGAEVKLTLSGVRKKGFILGEGQSFTLSQEARSALEKGADPYQFRDPIDPSHLQSTFAQESSRVLEATPIPFTVISGEDTEISSDDDEYLIITSPDNDATVESDTIVVSGKVNSRVSSIDINGYLVKVKSDRSFSQELALPDEDTVIINIEARDEEGIILAEANRTIKRIREPPDSPNITGPGGSGDVITVGESAIEITGNASSRTAGIIVNDYRLQLFKPGDRAWSYLASTKLDNFKVGENIYEISAVDSIGNVSTPARITIILSTTTPARTGTGVTSGPSTEAPTSSGGEPLAPGSLSVVLPQKGVLHETSEIEVLIEGKTSPETYSIEVNGYQLQLYEPGKDFWNYIASTELSTLRRGKNTYQIVARNARGEVLDEMEYTITLNVRG